MDSIIITKFKNSVLTISEIRKSREPEFEAVDYLSHTSAKYSKIYQYISDIEKIYREMQYVHILIKHTPFINIKGISDEDYVLYHQGYYLELVHQMKDKIFRILHIFKDIKNKDYIEKERLKLKHIFSDSCIFNQYSKLKKFINEWDENSQNPIRRCISKRTANHHFRSGLQLDNNYQQVKLSKQLMEINRMKELLSEKGKEIITKRGIVSFNIFIEKALENINNSNIFIEKNIENILTLLSKIYNLPIIDSKKGKKVFLINYAINREIGNFSSLEKLKKDKLSYAITNLLKDFIVDLLQGNLISLYITGSTARNERTNKSDFNFVIITKNKGNDALVSIINKFAKEFLLNYRLQFDILILDQAEFFEEYNFKVAFICDTDGILIYGIDLAKKIKHPKSGLGLAYLLSRDYKEKIYFYINYLQTNKDLSLEEINRINYKAAKDSLRLIFGVTMANLTVYTPRFEKMKEYILFEKPENFKFVCSVYAYLRDNVFTDRDTVEFMLTTVYIEKLFPLLDDLTAKASNWYMNWLANKSR